MKTRQEIINALGSAIDEAFEASPSRPKFMDRVSFAIGEKIFAGPPGRSVLKFVTLVATYPDESPPSNPEDRAYDGRMLHRMVMATLEQWRLSSLGDPIVEEVPPKEGVGASWPLFHYLITEEGGGHAYAPDEPEAKAMTVAEVQAQINSSEIFRMVGAEVKIVDDSVTDSFMVALDVSNKAPAGALIELIGEVGLGLALVGRVVTGHGEKQRGDNKAVKSRIGSHSFYSIKTRTA